MLAEAAKLPLDERAAHANWKVRSAAYDDLKAQCDRVLSDGDLILGELGALAPRGPG